MEAKEASLRSERIAKAQELLSVFTTPEIDEALQAKILSGERVEVKLSPGAMIGAIRALKPRYLRVEEFRRDASSWHLTFEPVEGLQITTSTVYTLEPFDALKRKVHPDPGNSENSNAAFEKWELLYSE